MQKKKKSKKSPAMKKDYHQVEEPLTDWIREAFES